MNCSCFKRLLNPSASVHVRFKTRKGTHWTSFKLHSHTDTLVISDRKQGSNPSRRWQHHRSRYRTCASPSRQPSHRWSQAPVTALSSPIDSSHAKFYPSSPMSFLLEERDCPTMARRAKVLFQDVTRPMLRTTVELLPPLPA